MNFCAIFLDKEAYRRYHLSVARRARNARYCTVKQTVQMPTKGGEKVSALAMYAQLRASGVEMPLIEVNYIVRADGFFAKCLCRGLSRVLGHESLQNDAVVYTPPCPVKKVVITVPFAHACAWNGEHRITAISATWLVDRLQARLKHRRNSNGPYAPTPYMEEGECIGVWVRERREDEPIIERYIWKGFQETAPGELGSLTGLFRDYTTDLWLMGERG